MDFWCLPRGKRGVTVRLNDLTKTGAKQRLNSEIQAGMMFSHA